MKQETPKQHVELINDNIEEFDKAIELFKQETLSGFEEGHKVNLDWLEQNSNQTKQETTLEEAIERLFIHYPESSGYIKAALIGKEWQQERMYSEEEVLKIVHDYRNHFEMYRNLQVLPNMFLEWFNQFKKK